MSCYHPLIGVYLGSINANTGKRELKVIPGEYNPSLKDIYGNDVIPIPCGKCIGCRLDYSRTWADRCMAEAAYHDNNIFLTLTYANQNLPAPLMRELDDEEIAENIRECIDNGETYNGSTLFVSPIHPVVKRDLQLFMKRLRDKFKDQKIRFFACGEYSDSMRPHYHLILFGLSLDDLKFLKKKNGNLYYTSDSISKLWPYGIHVISDVTWDTCAYVARYVVKKQKGKQAAVYEKLCYTPEFVLMSRKPGIGRAFYEDHNDIVIKPYYMPTKNGHKTLRSNKYYDRLFDLEYGDTMELIKEDRVENAKKIDSMRDEQTSLDYNSRMLSEEKNKLSQIKSLSRKEVL